jgi:hypothetical protein
MIRIFKKLALMVAMISCRLANAQGEVEAFRYSSSEPGMSARSMGMSGAYSSVGADVNSFYTNPAGLAVYKRTNVELAISNVSQTTTTAFDEGQKKDLRSRLSIGNFAFVKTQTPRSSRFTNLSYGIATAKTNHFYQNFTIEGKNNASLMDQFAWQAQGVNPDDLYNTLPFTSGLAYETYAIDPTDEIGSAYESQTFGTRHDLRKRVQREGRQSEIAFALAAQYSDKLYLGVALGITDITFNEISDYSETYPSTNKVKSLTYSEDLNTIGTGYVARLGAIYRLHDKVRVAASYQTRTATSLQDYYTTSASSLVDTTETQLATEAGTAFNMSSPELVSEYTLTSPSQWTLGISAIVGKMGIISLDWIHSDYRQISMNGSGENTYDYAVENALFDTLFRRTNQLRAGIEVRIRSSYYARAGFSARQSPLSNESKSLNKATHGWSGGIGYRDDHLFADLAISGTVTMGSYYLYDPALINPAVIRNNIVRVLLSVGVRF